MRFACQFHPPGLESEWTDIEAESAQSAAEKFASNHPELFEAWEDPIEVGVRHRNVKDTLWVFSVSVDMVPHYSAALVENTP